MPIYERGKVRIHYEEMGSGYPLLVIPGGGSTQRNSSIRRRRSSSAIRPSSPIAATPRGAGPSGPRDVG